MDYWNESPPSTRLILLVSIVLILGSCCIALVAIAGLGVSSLGGDSGGTPGAGEGTGTDVVVGYPDWKGEYFDNPDVNEPAVVVQNDPQIQFNWGAGSPASGVPADNYSVRWTRRTHFDEGNYYFRIDVEGGTRMWLDGRLLIDGWESLPLRTLDAESGGVAAGEHELRVDFQKRTGNGQITLRWEQVQASAAPVAAVAGPAQSPMGHSVSLSGAGSYASPGSQITGYQWDLGDGTAGQGVEVAHVYNAAGTYSAVLTVTDDKGLTGTAVHQIQVGDTAPPAGGSTPPPPEATEGPGQPGLEGENWILDDTVEGSQVTALFEGGNVTGSSGCNTYSGFYQVNGEDLSIEMGSVTNQVCAEAIMVQEAEYLSRLQGAEAYRLADGKLQMASVVNGTYVTSVFSAGQP